MDLKSSEPQFYAKLCKAPRLDAVKDTIRIWKDAGVAIEITNLIVPGYNDSNHAINGVIQFVLELGPDTPLHFSKFHPAYMLKDVDPTPDETVEKAVTVTKDKGLHYVYAGNLLSSRQASTYCPSCGSRVIQRFGYYLGNIDLDDHNRCSKCGEQIVLLGKPTRRRWLALS